MALVIFLYASIIRYWCPAHIKSVQRLYMTLRRYIGRLPIELLRKITTYCYCPQSDDLLEDIRSYHLTLKVLKDRYHRFWEGNWSVPDIPGEAQVELWLFNDLLCYINDGQAVNIAFTDKLHSIWRSHSTLRMLLRQRMSCLKTKTVSNQSRVIWALLSPNERTEFLSQKIIAMDTGSYDTYTVLPWDAWRNFESHITHP